LHAELLKHESGFPSIGYLRAQLKSGYAGFGMEAVGEGFDSDGSVHTI